MGVNGLGGRTKWACLRAGTFGGRRARETFVGHPPKKKARGCYQRAWGGNRIAMAR
jgi:hypothetical protein